MRNGFDEQLLLLNKEIIEMGVLCENAIRLSAQAVTTLNPTLAEKVSPLEDQVNQTERNIESMCLKLLLQQQPVARDLRQISSALKIITDMERIGDQASDIAEIVAFLKGRPIQTFEPIQKMAEETIFMVTKSVDAYVARDIALANSVIEHDDIVDDHFSNIKTQLIDMIVKDHTEGEYALDLLMIAKYFERIGDHAVNIAEWVIFSITGTHKGGKI